jgi:hypothetical protein
MGVPEASLRPSSKSSHNGSAESTLAPSGVPSVMEKSTDPPAGHPAETVDVKETAVSQVEPRRSSQLDRDGLAKEVATTTQEAKEETGGEEEEDDTVYPEKWKLALITIALCLSIFCMALGSLYFVRVHCRSGSAQGCNTC